MKEENKKHIVIGLILLIGIISIIYFEYGFNWFIKGININFNFIKEPFVNPIEFFSSYKNSFFFMVSIMAFIISCGFMLKSLGFFKENKEDWRDEDEY